MTLALVSRYNLIKFIGLDCLITKRSYMQQKDWLTYAGSLTEKMEAEGGQPIRVDLRRQGMAPLFAREQVWLNQSSRKWGWVREVELSVNEQPWIVARTVVPYLTLKHKALRLKMLKQKPLGPVLFGSLSAYRGKMTLKQVDAVDWMELNTEHPLWFRESLFSIDGFPLLVSELFLPENPVYGKN